MNYRVLLKKIFSITNENSHKILNILGVKLKLRTKPAVTSVSMQTAETTRLDEHFAMMRRITPRAELANFSVHLTEHCNLNCFGCTHFSTLAQKEFLDLETFKNDFERMAELTNSNVTWVITLFGGEPLLHPDLIKFFPIARKCFPNTLIKLLTNGTLLEKQKDDFWLACKKYDIQIGISNYPILNHEAIIEKLNYFDISSEWHPAIGQVLESYHFPLDVSGSQDARDNFLKCSQAHQCIALSKGKLCTCYAPLNIHHFNNHFKTNIPLSDRDYIDIYKAKDLDEILQFLARPIPFCKFCDINKRQFGLDWKVSEKTIEEWT